MEGAKSSLGDRNLSPLGCCWHRARVWPRWRGSASILPWGGLLSVSLIDRLLGSGLAWGNGLNIAGWRGLLLRLLWLLRLLGGLLACGLVDSARRDVKTFVNLLRDRLNLCAQLLFNPVQVETVLKGYEVNGETEVSKASRSANSMKVCLRVLGKVKVNDDIDSLDINAAGKEI